MDLRSNLNNYDEFNHRLKLSRDNDFRSSGVIFCGVKEHQRDKSGIHAHVAVVPPSESFDRDIDTQEGVEESRRGLYEQNSRSIRL